MTPTVLVTGGSRGIGYATAEVFARKGWNVALCSRSEEDAAKAAAAIGKDVLGLRADIGDRNDVERLFTAVDQRFPTLNAVVNNAGIFHGGSVFDLSDEKFDALFRVNVTGLAQCCKQAFIRMKKTGGGIVNISSIAGISGTQKFPNFWAYTATKFAVVGLTEGLAVEGKPYNIRVNCVAPGATETEMLRKAAPGLKASAQPVDIARIAYYLCDASQSGILTGATIPVLN